LDADDKESIVESSNLVSNWLDKSGEGAAKQFLQYLKGSAAREVMQSYGYRFLEE